MHGEMCKYHNHIRSRQNHQADNHFWKWFTVHSTWIAWRLQWQITDGCFQLSWLMVLSGPDTNTNDLIILIHAWTYLAIMRLYWFPPISWQKLLLTGVVLTKGGRNLPTPECHSQKGLVSCLVWYGLQYNPQRLCMVLILCSFIHVVVNVTYEPLV